MSALRGLKGLLRPHVRRARAWVHRHTGAALADYERRYDLNQLQRFEALLNRHGRSLRACASILEFGCGDGRLTRYLFEFLPAASVHGCDVLPEAIAACQRRYPKGRFVANQASPPLPFADETFDLVYSYSVFTHLSEPNHLAWLHDLARVLKPGGMMLHTVHAYECLRRASFFSPPERLTKYRLPRSVDAFLESRHGYTYVVDKPEMPEYGQAIISKEYVMANWPRYTGLQLLDYVEGAIEAYPEGCQDLVLLAKEGTNGSASGATSP